MYFVHNRAIDTQALFLRQACSSEFVNGEKKNGEAWALFLLFVRRAWIEVPANSDGLPVNAFVKTTKSRLHFKWQGEKFDAFLRFKGIFDSEWVLLKLDESGSKF